MPRPVRNKRYSSRFPLGFLFWIVFFIVIAVLFIIKMPTIAETWRNVFGKSGAEQIESDTVPPPVQTEEITVIIEPPAVVTETPVQIEEAAADSAVAETGDAGAGGEAVTRAGAQQRTSVPAENNPPARTQAETAPPPSLRERTIYLVSIDSTGLVFTSAAKRMIPVNDSPLVSTLNMLLQGPTAAEKRLSLISLIPEGTRILGARVQGSTATINFNDNFMFNTYGAEGYIGQLRQIIWTATEFPNISDVQILIEGKKIEFLGETLRIDRPLGRDSI